MNQQLPTPQPPLQVYAPGPDGFTPIFTLTPGEGDCPGWTLCMDLKGDPWVRWPDGEYYPIPLEPSPVPGWTQLVAHWIETQTRAPVERRPPHPVEFAARSALFHWTTDLREYYVQHPCGHNGVYRIAGLQGPAWAEDYARHGCEPCAGTQYGEYWDYAGRVSLGRVPERLQPCPCAGCRGRR